jgi:hypothetical protein
VEIRTREGNPEGGEEGVDEGLRVEETEMITSTIGINKRGLVDLGSPVA